MQPTPSLGPNIPLKTLGGIESWKNFATKPVKLFKDPKEPHIQMTKFNGKPTDLCAEIIEKQSSIRDPTNVMEWVRDSTGQPTGSPAQTIDIIFNIHFPSNSDNQICTPPNQTENFPNLPITYEHLFTAQKIQWAIKSLKPYIYPICLQPALSYITAILQQVRNFLYIYFLSQL